MKILIVLCLGLSTSIYAQQNSGTTANVSSEAQARGRLRKFESRLLTMTILPGWMEHNSVDPRLNLQQGKYLLSINPIFTHASGIEGGRFSEIVEGMPSIDAVMRNVDQPASGGECSQPEVITVNKDISVSDYYTDSSKTANGCSFPSGGESAWFGSLFSCSGSESDCTITLAYDTSDVNALPRKGGPELRRVFDEVVAMLKTLQFKPPILISTVDPPSAPPGTRVTIHGSGFKLLNTNATLTFGGITDNAQQDPIITDDGKSLTFQVPTSILTVSCQLGRILIGGFCLPTPPNHVDVNDCPRKSDGSSNFCGIPIPPATYQIWVTAGGVNAGPVDFTVSPPKPNPVSISLMYPVSFVSAGDKVTVLGRGFTPSGNRVQIGSVFLDNLSSPDGKTITFLAPEPGGNSLIHCVQIYEASVSNATGQSNPISFNYRDNPAQRRNCR